MASNCSATLQGTTLSAAFCDSANSSSETSAFDEEKCFPVDYSGSNHSGWIAGFTIAVVFSFLASVGINLQKKALKQNEAAAVESNKEPAPAYSLPLWVVGFILIIVGSVLDFVAFGLAPQSLLAPLAALTLVWNMVQIALLACL